MKIGSHVSICPNHQTLRVTPLDTRFRVASLGLLGYECNLQEVPKEELVTIKKQIEIYKKWRKTLQYGQVYRIGGKLNKGNISLIGLEDNTTTSPGIMCTLRCVPDAIRESAAIDSP